MDISHSPILAYGDSVGVILLDTQRLLLVVDLDDVPVRIGDEHQRRVDGDQCLHDGVDLVGTDLVACLREAGGVSERAVDGEGRAGGLDDVGAHGLQPGLGGGDVGHDHADVREGVGRLDPRRQVPGWIVQVQDLEQPVHVVLVPVHLGASLVARAVAPALGVAHVCDGEMRRHVDREHEPEPKGSLVPVDALGEVTHVDPHVVDGIARRRWVGCAVVGGLGPGVFDLA